jgi:EAL domain-containing protein (putative c-di-GMP-specific phosphodiesterase class I)
VEIALDDFGTGYSSLGHLRKLPIRHLKIDRTFIRDIDTQEGDHPLITAIIALAHNLNLRVVAEGVETAEQFEFLHRHGCDRMQGWLTGRPMPAEQLSKELRGGYRWRAAEAAPSP